MKKSLAILIFALFPWTGCNNVQEEISIPSTEYMTVNRNDSLFSTINGLTYYKEKLFIGVLSEKFEDGKERSITEYLNGAKNGKELIWYYSGQLYSVRFYKNGFKDSVHTGYWPNGNKKFEYCFSDGNYDGFFKEWYEDGNISVWFNYKNGKENGSQKGWRDNGELFINYVVKNGKIYGAVKSRLCYSVQHGQGQFTSTVTNNVDGSNNGNDRL